MSEKGTPIGLLIIFRAGYNCAFPISLHRAHSLMNVVRTHSEVTVARVTNPMLLFSHRIQ